MGILRDTPIILRDKDHNIILKKIGDIRVIWFYNLDTHKDEGQLDYEVWTYKGWKKINRIIRYNTSNDIYKIMTNYGIICTDNMNIEFIYGNLPEIDKNYDITKLNMSEKQLLHYIKEYTENKIRYEDMYTKKIGKSIIKISRTDNYLYKLDVDCDYYHVGISHINITTD